MNSTHDLETTLKVIALSDWPELLNPLWVMPKDIREKAKACDANAVEELLDIGAATDTYIARLWFVCADRRSGKQKMGWLINHYKTLKNVHYLRPDMLDELYVQVQLKFIPANRVRDIFAGLDGKNTIGEVAYSLGLYNEIDIEKTITQAIKNNPKAVEDYKNGNTKALGVILGAIRKAGVTDMKTAHQIIIKQLAAPTDKKGDKP